MTLPNLRLLPVDADADISPNFGSDPAPIRLGNTDHPSAHFFALAARAAALAIDPGIRQAARLLQPPQPRQRRQLPAGWAMGWPAPWRRGRKTRAKPTAAVEGEPFDGGRQLRQHRLQEQARGALLVDGRDGSAATASGKGTAGGPGRRRRTAARQAAGWLQAAGQSGEGDSGGRACMG